MTVGDTLTQLRATIKKLIKASIPAKQSIYDLAIKVVGDSPCTVTVKLCTRLALMRNLYTDDTSFWDKVDKKLNIIRKAALKGGGAAGNQERITRALSTYLDLDRTKYGTQSEVHNIPELGDVWQQDVDEVIQGTTSRAEPRTPTPTTPLGEPITPTPTPGTISLLPEASGNPSASSSGTT
ncbi:hypothetical protein H0H81_002047 [Sphagnurus paluster]|uniref:Uncharacterized protein n=1 Tax=Sphagnurus paluster TaxID=117069 RepID=A0A9P7KGQ0_9AGAR|nr:hypothetical protein H0H81_002047 [Sphagnurus paluster]